MDHEFSSSQLEAGQVGWDWAGVQLFDGREIMIYRMRRADGKPDPASQLTWVEKDGKTAVAPHEAFDWEPGGLWHSPVSGADYPIHARIRTVDPANGQSRILTLRPVADDQELSGAISGLPYWEGACDVLDESGQVIGRAFLELAGYAGDLAKHLRGK